jgi:hypothetical protein
VHAITRVCLFRIKKPEVTHHEIVRCLSTSKCIKRYHAGRANCRIIDVTLLPALFSAERFVLQFSRINQLIAEQTSSCRIRQDKAGDAEDISDVATVGIVDDLRSNLNPRDEVLMNERIKDKSALHRIGAQKQVIDIAETLRGLLVGDVADNRYKTNVGVRNPRNPLGNVNFESREAFPNPLQKRTLGIDKPFSAVGPGQSENWGSGNKS